MIRDRSYPFASAFDAFEQGHLGAPARVRDLKGCRNPDRLERYGQPGTSAPFRFLTVKTWKRGGRPRFPKHSGFIDESLFWYLLEYIRDGRIPEEAPGPEGSSAEYRALPRAEDQQKDPPFYIQTINLDSGIKRLYVNRAYVPRCWSRESWFIDLMEGAARFNLQRLIGGRVKPEFEAKALEAIEAQLALVPRETTKTRQPRAIFAHLERWKASREKKGPRRRSAAAQATA